MDNHVDIYQWLGPSLRIRLVHIIQPDVMGGKHDARIPVRIPRLLFSLHQNVLEGVSWTF